MQSTRTRQRATPDALQTHSGDADVDAIVDAPLVEADPPHAVMRTSAENGRHWAAVFYGACALILGASLFAAVYRNGMPSMWLDEASSWHNVRGGWSRLMSYCVGGDDSSGFAYANLLKLWTLVFGASSETTMRWLSALIVVAFVGVMLQVSRRLWGNRAAICVGILAAVHPEVIFWSRQIRTYALVLLATSLCLWGLVAYLQSPAQRRPKRLLIAGSCLLVASHLFGFFFVCGMAVFLAMHGWLNAAPSQRLRQAVSQAAPLKWAVVLGLGWALVMRSRIQDSLNDFWIGGTMGENALHLVNTLLPSAALWTALLALGLLLMWRRRQDLSNRTALLAFFAIALPVVLGPLAATLMARGDHNFVHPRYAISLIPLLLLPIGYCLARIPYRTGVVAAIIVAAATLYVSDIGRLYRPDAPWGDDTRAATRYLNAHARSHDVAMLLPWCERIAFEYYGLTMPLEGAPRDDLAKCLGTWTERWGPQPRRDWAAERVWLILIHGEPRRTYADVDLSAFPQKQFGKLRVVRIDSPQRHAPQSVNAR